MPGRPPDTVQAGLAAMLRALPRAGPALEIQVAVVPGGADPGRVRPAVGPDGAEVEPRIGAERADREKVTRTAPRDGLRSVDRVEVGGPVGFTVGHVCRETAATIRTHRCDGYGQRADAQITWGHILKASVQRLAFWRR